ncbi:MAG: PEP-CTERM-box response regulator transcription factor [Limisphaerales bacterium]
MHPEKPLLLIVDDDEEIRSQIKWALLQDYEVRMAGSRSEALAALETNPPGVVLLDLGLPPHPSSPDEGLAALGDILAAQPQTKVIIVSGQSDKQNALAAIGAGAYDFLPKPIDLEQLRLILARAFYVAGLEREHRELQQHQQIERAGFEGMLGTSPQVLEVFGKIRKVATTDAPVLILGESGTGKEMTALAIHRRSLRCDGPFIPINCGAIPETLRESELFGPEKGSCPGAHVPRKGRIESAHGGTLFLDEIGELPPPLQVKLLRFLQEQTVQRVGGRESIKVDVRVLSATNINLEQALASGALREDLYYRLGVVVLKLPAMRERGADVILLARAFLQRFSRELSKGSMRFSPEALRLLQAHPWPGNVRELENRIRRGAIMAEGKQVAPVDLELGGSTTEVLASLPHTLKDAREAAERQVIEAALARHQWKLSPTAIDLGISRPTLYELLEKLGLSRPVE